MKIETKRVLHLVDGEPVIEDVPMSWIKCSVLHEFRPETEFMRDGVVVRTNCEKTYSGMALDEMNKTIRINAEKTKSKAWRDMEVEIQAHHNRVQLQAHMNQPYYACSVSELIEMLSKLDPNARVTIDSESDGYTTPNIRLIDPNLEGYYVL